MKTLSQISKQYNIARSTLKYRFKIFGFDSLQKLNEEEEKKVTERIFTQSAKYLKKINPLLVFEFKVENPYMSNEEISYCLAIPQGSVDEILNDDCITIQSKSNNWH